jgi:CheY-like chemotaxis protein
VLVVLDLMMPNLDGFEVLRRLRAEKLTMPVVVLTGKTLTAAEQATLRDGFIAFVRKGGHALEDVIGQAKTLLLQQRAVTNRSARILYIEDNPQNRDIVRRYIGNTYELIEAEDGEHGLERAQRDAPDLVLMDLSLPRVDGWEATRRLRALPAAISKVPVIAVTAHAGREYQDKAIEAGCDAYLTKPLDRDQLLDAIRKHLGKNNHG